MSDATTTQTDTTDAQAEPATQLSFSTFGKVTINDHSQVDVPADRAADFGRAVNYFSAHSNRHTMTVDLGNESEAKLFAKQVNSYASTHKLSTSPKREGSVVTFRFAKTRAPKTVDTTTVTVTKAADLPKSGK